ncbi:hypothetical protein HV87_08070 [Pseudomonas aeruginosa]|nr:hypothetical protein HV87_08070 [Pseudomonas aeruginosa]
MSEVYRYKAVQLISESGGRIGYDPHGPDVVMAAAYDELLAHQLQRRPVTLPAYEAKLSSSHDWDQGYSDGWKACLEEVTKLGPLYIYDDSRVLEIDERAEFEAYAIEKGWLVHQLKQRADGNYEDWGVNPEWQAWKARAAVGRKP